MARWNSVWELDEKRARKSGSAEALQDAVRRGADLRVYTEFRHNEHIDTSSDNPELIQEVTDFRITYLVEDRWVAGIINLRMPIALPEGFGARPSMSFFMYNENGQQAIARPYLDGKPASGVSGASPIDQHPEMPKYHQEDNWDAETNAPSHNFVYDFGAYRFCVNDEWKEALSHAADGSVVSGSVDALAKAFAVGCEVKVAIRDLCADIASDSTIALGHEVFVHVGSCYYYTERKLFMAASHPVVRVRPAIPMKYTSHGWDFGWLMPRTDGHVARWLVNPYTLKFEKSAADHAIRWFVR